jgi:hypothetical protein
MNTHREPTNAEIYEKLGSIEGRVTVVLEDQNIKINEILKQVKETNGRVTRLERWKDKLDVIADYKKENSQGEIIVDWPKIIMAVLGLLATALSVIAFMVGKK